jgi:hypothetical protein
MTQAWLHHALFIAALLLALSAAAAAAADDAAAARCDPEALSRLRFNLKLKSSKPWSHASLVLDVTNVGVGSRPDDLGLRSDPEDVGAVNLAGLQFTVGLAFRVGELVTTRTRTTSSALPEALKNVKSVEWTESPGDDFRSFCLYGEMVRSEDDEGDAAAMAKQSEEEEAVFGSGESACDEVGQYRQYIKLRIQL